MGGNRATLQTIEKRRYSIASIIKSWKSACVRACVCTAERAPRDPEENSCAHHRHQAVRLGLMTVLDPPDSVVRSMANLCLPSLLSPLDNAECKRRNGERGRRKRLESRDSTIRILTIYQFKGFSDCFVKRQMKGKMKEFKISCSTFLLLLLSSPENSKASWIAEGSRFRGLDPSKEEERPTAGY